MLSISHAAAGAALAVAIPNPAVSIPLIFASHYLLDAVAHWDAGTGLSSGKKSIKSAILHEIPDLLLAAILVLVIFPLPSYDPSSLLHAWKQPQVWGAFLALVPDFLEAPRNFLKYEPWFLKPINNFHHSFHHSIPRVLDGLTPQLLLLVLIWLTR